MLQSELKSKLLKEKTRVSKENKTFWDKIKNQPNTYRKMICKNIKYSISGHDDTGAFGMCWHCDKCGRSGCNYDKNSIRRKDIFIEEKCDLKEG